MGKQGAHTEKAITQAAGSGVSGVVFDAGGLIALERSDRRIASILAIALDSGSRIILPATALAEVIRNPARQVRLRKMLQHEQTEVVPLDALHAHSVGALLARTGTSDIADAHVVICAQACGLGVITSDPLDLRRLDPTIALVNV